MFTHILGINRSIENMWWKIDQQSSINFLWIYNDLHHIYNNKSADIGPGAQNSAHIYWRSINTAKVLKQQKCTKECKVLWNCEYTLNVCLKLVQKTFAPSQDLILDLNPWPCWLQLFQKRSKSDLVSQTDSQSDTNKILAHSIGQQIEY